MPDNELDSILSDITSAESATVSGGDSSIANFDLNSYVFVIGGGAVFNGGVTTNVVNIAFNKSVFVQSGSLPICN